MPTTEQAPARVTKYDYDVGALDASSHYGRLALKVGTGKRVLELGSSSGYLSEALTRQFGCRVVAVEIDEQAAAAAAPRCERVVVADLDSANLSEILAGEQFDVVLLADILEHLREPSRTLRQLLPLIAPGGRIVASIPHVGHGSVRLALFSGQFPYRPMGVLDDTHLRHFNRRSLEELFETAGYRITQCDRNIWGIFDTEVGSRLGSYPDALLSLLRSDPESSTYQFIVEASPLDPSSAFGDRQRSAAGLAPLQANALPFVEFVLFETAEQPVNDLVISYLKTIDYPSRSLRYHIVRADDRRVDTQSKLVLEPFEFGDHDFTTFKFAPAGSALDGQTWRPRAGRRQEINKGAILRWLTPRLTGDLVFVADSGRLPAAGCLQALVRAAGTQTDSLCFAALPEIANQAPSRVEGEKISWSPLSCVLLRKTALTGKQAIDPDLESPAQDVDFCWRLWLAGAPPVLAPGARCFETGPRSWHEDALPPALLYDAVRMRAVWGSWRMLASFLKNSILSNSGLSTGLALLAVSVLSLPVWLRQKAQLGSLAGKSAIAFHGRGYSRYGPPPAREG